MTEDQRQAWKRAIAAKNARGRQRHRRGKDPLANLTAGMTRLPPPRAQPARVGRASTRWGS